MLGEVYVPETVSNDCTSSALGHSIVPNSSPRGYQFESSPLRGTRFFEHLLPKDFRQDHAGRLIPCFSPRHRSSDTQQ